MQMSISSANRGGHQDLASGGLVGNSSPELVHKCDPSVRGLPCWAGDCSAGVCAKAFSLRLVSRCGRHDSQAAMERRAAGWDIGIWVEEAQASQKCADATAVPAGRHGAERRAAGRSADICLWVFG